MRQPLCLFLLAGLLTGLVCTGQPQAKDSLHRLISQSAPDTQRVMLLLRLADQFESNQQDSARHYLEAAKKLADALQFTKGQYEYFAQSVILMFTVGEYEKALQESGEAMRLARQMKDSDRIINTLGNTGIIYQYTGDYEQQLSYSLQALDLIEKRRDSLRLVSMYHNTANAYASLKQHRKAADLCLLALRVYQRHPGNAYLNRIYASLGQAYYEMQQQDSAIAQFKTAIAKSRENGDSYAEAIILGYLANAYAAIFDFVNMLDVAERGLGIARTLQSNQALASALYNAAFAQFYKGNNDAARNHIEEAIAIAGQESLQEELRNSYQVLSYVAARDGRFKESAMAKGKADSLQQAVLNETVLSKTSELEKKYETAKKDAQLQQQRYALQRKNMLNYALGGTIVALLALGLLARRNYQHKQLLQRQRILELEKEKQLNAAEAVLKGEEQERRRLAKDLHDGLGGMLSGIKFSLQHMQRELPNDAQPAIDRSLDMLDSSISEMRRVAHNMMPEVLMRFGLDKALQDYCHSIREHGQLQLVYQSSGLDQMEKGTSIDITVYRIVQELMNNIVKHAQAKNALVQATFLEDKLTITVEDDGVGFEPDKTNEKGIGWTNILSRVAFLNGQIDVKSGTGEGTSVLVELPANADAST